MILGPQLRSLRLALEWSQGVFADELGLTGTDAPNRVNEMEQGRRMITGPISKLTIRIAKEHGYHLTNSGWEKTDER